MPIAASAGLFDSLYQPVADLVEKGTHYLLNPAEAAGAAADLSGAIAELVKLALLADDPASLLKRPLSGSRRAAWAPPLPLGDVKALAHSLDCTVNDVLMATLAGALRQYLRAHRQTTAALTLHAAVPVNLRSDTGAPTLGNRFGLVLVELPVGIHAPLERLYRVRDAMRSLKASSQGAMTFGLLAAVGALPQAVEETAVEAFTAKASLVVSNVPGPSEVLQFAGVTVREVLFWVPQAGSIGTGASLLSYRDEVHFGVMSDRELMPEPAELVRAFGDEFERLILLLSLLPGGPRPAPVDA